jgi:hypothetical protein
MPHWVLSCPSCNQDFKHSEVQIKTEGKIDDPFVWVEAKPALPEGGLECPNCKTSSVFERHQLRYSAE